MTNAYPAVLPMGGGRIVWCAAGWAGRSGSPRRSGAHARSGTKVVFGALNQLGRAQCDDMKSDVAATREHFLRQILKSILFI